MCFFLCFKRKKSKNVLQHVRALCTHYKISKSSQIEAECSILRNDYQKCANILERAMPMLAHTDISFKVFEALRNNDVYLLTTAMTKMQRYELEKNLVR